MRSREGVRRAGAPDWRELPLLFPCMENSRGINVADMAYALTSGRPHRASGDLAYHVLDVMEAFGDASHAGEHIELGSGVPRPRGCRWG